MGWRGAAGGLVSGTKLEYGGRSMSIFKFLNQDDIRRANDASITDMGDIIKRMFLSNSKEINNFELSSQEKKDAIDEMAKLSTAALKAAAAAVNPYVSGPARLTHGQRSGSLTGKAADVRGSIDSYMKELRNKSDKNVKARKERELASALTSAANSGKLEITVDGKRYYRKSKRGKYWYS